MFKRIFIHYLAGFSIIRRVYIHALESVVILHLKQVQRMKIVAIDHQSICLRVQIRYTLQQPEFECIGKILGIDDQILIQAQKIDGRRGRPAFRFVDSVHGDPFINLRFVPDNLCPEGFIDLVQRDAPVGLHHEFLL